MKPIHNFMGVSVLILFLLLGGACTTSTHSAINTTELSPSPTLSQAQAPTPDQHDHKAEDNVARIKADEALRLVKAGEAILVDVRDASSYETMHAKGALNVTYQDISEGKYNKLPKNKHLIFYCT
jgi:3-mercaptopyruvate sulfurtransferase SseA